MIKLFRKFLIYILVIIISFSCVSLYHRQSKIVDFAKLENFLKNQEWIQADRETTYLIGAILRKNIEEKKSSFFGASRLDWPFRTLKSGYMIDTGICCKYLHNIDRLWSIYSNGEFGFTNQVKIALSIGKIILLPGESTEKMTKHELIDRLSWDNRAIESKFGWERKEYVTLRDGLADSGWYDVARNPKKVPGFLPSPQWILEEASGKFPYKIEDAIMDFAHCNNFNIGDSISVSYLSKPKEIKYFQDRLLYNKKNKYQRNTKRLNCI
jgi:GUN4-like